LHLSEVRTIILLHHTVADSSSGIFFGYDSGYINGVLASAEFVRLVTGQTGPTPVLPGSTQSLITAILSAGTFFGAIIAGDVSDILGRRNTVVLGCLIYIIGVILQMAVNGLGLIVAGRLIAGLGVGFESAIVILYMSEIVSPHYRPYPVLETITNAVQCPKKVRGALVAGYQFAITIGLLLAACVNYAVKDRTDSGAYRIPIAIQFIWGLALGGGLLMLPDSPRFFVKKGKVDQARAALARLRSQPADSSYVEEELAEIVANDAYEKEIVPSSTWYASWMSCFRGSLFKQSSSLRRTILGTALQMMQQWTGVNFIFYYSTPFLKSTGAIKNEFLISLIFTLVNVCSTPISFYTVEKLGRRPLLVWGAFAMMICQVSTNEDINQEQSS